METTPKTTLIEDMALTLKCQYIIDLLSMTEGQQMKLYRKLKKIQPEEYTLFCWNDAFESYELGCTWFGLKPPAEDVLRKALTRFMHPERMIFNDNDLLRQGGLPI